MPSNADGLSCPRLVELWNRMGWASKAWEVLGWVGAAQVYPG